jgi:hypothetical protein
VNTLFKLGRIPFGTFFSFKSGNEPINSFTSTRSLLNKNDKMLTIEILDPNRWEAFVLAAADVETKVTDISFTAFSNRVF